MRLPVTFTLAFAALGCLGCGQSTTSSATDESKQNPAEQKEKATSPAVAAPEAKAATPPGGAARTTMATSPSTVAAPKTSAATPSDLERLKGTWLVVALEAGGKPVAAERLRALKLQYVFDGNKLTMRRPDKPDQVHTISLDPSSNPRRMTSKQADLLVHSIYAMDGNTLRLCLMVDDNPSVYAGFPKDFVSRAAPMTDLLTLQRQ
jgi:uncharacterized protein (TIGR03067 family)